MEDSPKYVRDTTRMSDLIVEHPIEILQITEGNHMVDPAFDEIHPSELPEPTTD